VRSADEKLQQVAVVAAAGRMCGYRTSAIRAHAEGAASEEQLRAARAHLAACGSCRRSYVLIVREMRSAGFQRRGALAFLPLPPIAAAHHVLRRVLDRVALPQGLRDRAAEAVGGAGVVKVAAAGSAIVATTTTLAVSLHHALEHPKARAVPRAPTRVARGSENRDTTVVARRAWDARAYTVHATRHSRQRPHLPAYREFSFERARAASGGHGGSTTPTTTGHAIESPARAAKEFTFERAAR
jgi:hypothetical protein